MSTSSHSRNGSATSQSTTSSGSSYQVIYDHIMSYPGTYDIPLRRMYELNCAPQQMPSATSTADNSPVAPSFPWVDHQARAAQFAVSLSQQISQLPSQPSSLPPSFVHGFVRKAFPEDLCEVDFPHALAALDYMKDLEMRRRRELANSLRNLGITENSFEHKTAYETTALTEEISRGDPRIADWINNLEENERKVDSFYTQCYIALRRWIMINEMSLLPFNKSNCVAMLNTLYPPVMSSIPTRKLNEKILVKQREGFFKYIQTVEKRGVSVLKNLMLQGAREGEQNGWPATHRFVLQYLNTAVNMIKECEDINMIELDTRPQLTQSLSSATITPHSIEATSHASPDASTIRKDRKTDSGVSFNSECRHSNSSSSGSTASFAMQVLPEQQPTALGKGGSTLERIARELRKIRTRPRLNTEGITSNSSTYEDTMEESLTPTSPRSPKGFSTSLRKMKSFGSLNDLKHSNTSASSIKTTSTAATTASAVTASTVPNFDVEAMKRHREAFEQRSKVGGPV